MVTLPALVLQVVSNLATIANLSCQLHSDTVPSFWVIFLGLTFLDHVVIFVYILGTSQLFLKASEQFNLSTYSKVYIVL